MEKKPSTRRNFLKKTSIGAAGLALTASGMSSINFNTLQDTGKPAILGGSRIRPENQPFGTTWPIHDDVDLKIFVDAYKAKRWCEYRNSEREHYVQFQNQFAKLMGVKYCATTNAGTNALETAQRVYDIGPGDEVITQTNTFIATAQSTFNLYALPILIDSDPETFQMNADLIEERITRNTRAIIPVHIGGAAADLEKIIAIAKKHNLIVIEDACQAHMGEWKNKKLGSIGDLGCFSFNHYKELSGGEGGAVIGNDNFIMSKVSAYVNNGRDPESKNRTFAGTNFRMPTFISANLLGQIRRLEEQSLLRDENSLYLEKMLSGIKGVRPVKKNPGQTKRAHYNYQMIYEKEHFSGLPKGKFQEAMKAEGIILGNGIDSSLHSHNFIDTYLNLPSFKRVFTKKRLEKYRNENVCPVNEHIFNETGLNIPHHVFLGTKKDMEEIVAAIVKIQKYSSKIL